jgi:hypothetical protein
MSIVPTNLAASMAGTQSVERPEVREKDRRDKVRTGARPGDQRDPDQVVVSLETADAIRDLAGNTEEQAQQDRHGQAPYDPAGRLNHAAGRPHIDVQG